MTQVNGLPDEHRDLKTSQGSMQNSATTDMSEVAIFADDGSEEKCIMLDEVVVIAKAPPKKPLYFPTVEIEIPQNLNLNTDNIRMSAADLVTAYGGKFQKREVNGEKQEIVILKYGKEKLKFAVNEDGSLGEPLVTISTFGKNKYITNSEHERRMREILHGDVPEGVEVEYLYENGEAYPIFKKDGKRLSSSELKALMPDVKEDTIVDKPAAEDVVIEEPVIEEHNDDTIDEFDIETNRKRNLYTNSLATRTLNDYSGQNLITPEILALFKNGDADLSYGDLLDETGKIKPEFKLFDLNGDNKLDDKEKAFFSSGGRVLSKETLNLSIENFIESIIILDSFDANDNGNNLPDNKIRYGSGATLYRMLSASYSLLEKLDYLPEEIQQKYSQALEKVTLNMTNSSDNVGQYTNNRVGVNLRKAKSMSNIELVLLHELTHHILTNDLEMGANIIQEVETFYMQYKFYKANKGNNTGQNSVIEEYARYADELKSKNPKITEKELAVETFLKIYFDQYKEEYSEHISKRGLKKQVKKTNFLYLK